MLESDGKKLKDSIGEPQYRLGNIDVRCQCSTDIFAPMKELIADMHDSMKVMYCGG